MTSARPGRSWFVSRRAAFWMVGTVFFLLVFANGAPTPLYGIYQARWHFSAATLTALFAVYAVALLAALLVLGRLSDYLGRRPVILAGVALNAAACVLWWLAPGLAALFAARVLQGLGVGVATGAIGASLLELQPPGSGRAAVLTTASTTMGLAAGALAASALVQYGPDPTRLIWWLLLAGFAAGLAAIAVMPEPDRSPGRWLPSLRPTVRVPPAIRATFAAALPSVIATWALTSFYLSLGPTLTAQLLHSANLVWGGLAVFLVAGAGSISGVAAARTPPRPGMIGGCLILLAGAGLTFAAITGSVPWLFLAGTAVAGLGFGAAWTGAYRMLTAAVAPADRAGLVDAIFIAAYLALSLPAVTAGLASQHYGLRDTALVYIAVIAALVAAAAAMTGLRRPPPLSGQAVSQPPGRDLGREEAERMG